MIIIFIFKYFLSGIRFLILSFFNLIKWFIIGLITSIFIFPYYFVIGIYFLCSKNKRRELGFTKPIIPMIMMILSLATYFISIFILTRWFVQNERIKKMSESIIESTVILEMQEENINSNIQENNNSPSIPGSDVDSSSSTSNSNSDSNSISYYNYSFEVDFNVLLNRNSDTVAWLKVPGTNVNYPVVQSNDNKYYLEHDIYKNVTNVGWIFADYRSNFDYFENNTIIYGHNLTNKTMFGSLPRILRSSWYNDENNYYINMNTVNAKVVWKVFSVYTIDPVTDYLRTNFYSNYEYIEWLNLMKSRSIYNFGDDVSADDKVLTLSTCDDTGNKRVVLQAKMISIEYN